MAPVGGMRASESRQKDPPEKVLVAAQQFEALMIGQILRAAREGSSGSSSDCAMDYAEQQFATVMARNGGLGLARLIVQGLEAHK